MTIVFGLAGLLAAIAALLGSWESAIPPARLVTIYRTHRCGCAFEWADSLRAQGFTVRLFEYETLRHVRRSLHTPPNLHGCHVGAYLDYFVEGHVSAAALTVLGERRPRGLGLTTEDSLHLDADVSVAADENSRVLLIDSNGRATAWFGPAPNPHG